MPQDHNSDDENFHGFYGASYGSEIDAWFDRYAAILDTLATEFRGKRVGCVLARTIAPVKYDSSKIDSHL